MQSGSEERVDAYIYNMIMRIFYDYYSILNKKKTKN